MKWLDFVAQMEQGMRASHAERALTSEGCSMTNLVATIVLGLLLLPAAVAQQPAFVASR